MNRNDLQNLYDSGKFLELIRHSDWCAHPDDYAKLSRANYYVGNFTESYELTKSITQLKGYSNKLMDIFIKDFEELGFNQIGYYSDGSFLSREDKNGYYPECSEALLRHKQAELIPRVKSSLEQLNNGSNDAALFETLTLFDEAESNNARLLELAQANSDYGYWNDKPCPAFTSGMLHFEMKEYEAAEKYFLQATAITPGKAVYWGYYAMCLYLLDRNPIYTVRVLEQCIFIDEYNPRWYYLKALNLYLLMEKPHNLFKHEDIRENALQILKMASSLCTEVNVNLLNDIKKLYDLIVDVNFYSSGE